MNVHRDLKIVWWAPERCGTKITAEIFKKLGFEVYDPHKKTFSSMVNEYHSHKILFPEEFSDYKLICNVRNPYDRVLSFYLNFTSVGKNMVYTKNKIPQIQKKIDLFTIELFHYAIRQKKLVNMEREIPVRDYVQSLSFDGKIPDHLIKMENLTEDLGSLDFVRDSDLWKSGEFQDMIEKNDFINKRPFSYKDFFQFESARRVFNFFEKHFYICDYDPFSFSKTELTNDEKMKFFHEPF